MRATIGAAIALAIPAAIPAASQAAPAGDPATYSVGFGRPAPTAMEALRPVAQTGPVAPDGGAADVPPTLKALAGDFWVQARVSFTVTADDRIEGCTGARASMLMGKGVLDEPAVTAAACALVAARQHFVHALDAQGMPVAAGVEQSIWFRRMLATSPGLWRSALPPPAPLPIVPNTQWPPMMVPVWPFRPAEPDWSASLPPRRQIAGPLVAGVLFDVEAPGTVTACSVKLPSGNAAFDAAVCKALAGSGQTFAGKWKLVGYPLKVAWDGKAARMILPSAALGPVFSGYGAGLPPRTGTGALPVPARVGLRVRVDGAGKPVDCRVTSGSGSDALDLESCRAAMAETRFQPARDVFGDTAPGSVALMANWSDGVWGVPID